MSNILEEMVNKVQGRFFGFYIFLSANMAILSLYLCITI